MSASNTPPLSLKFKLASMISLLLIAGITIIGLTILDKQNRLQQQQLKELGITVAAQLGASISESLLTDNRLSLQLMLANFVALPRIAGALILDTDGQLIAQAGYLNYTDLERLRPSATTNTPQILQLEDDSLLLISRSRFREVSTGYVVIQLRAESLLQAYSQSLFWIISVCALVALGGLFAAYWISRGVSQPITEILRATHAITGQPAQHSDSASGARKDELGQLSHSISRMGHRLYRQQQVEELLNRFLSRDIAQRILSDLDTINVGGQRVEATVLFADIVGFTSLSEKLSPEQVAELLNEYFHYFTICARHYFGSIDKFIGDCAMIVFGAAKPDPQHQFHAVACAVLLQKLMRNLNQRRTLRGQTVIELRIGINSGDMLAGVLGNQQRMEYTVVGDSVNLASRLCSEAGAGEIIISHEVYRSLFTQQSVIANIYKRVKLRGKSAAIDTYLVDSLSLGHQLSMDSVIDDVLNNSVVS